MSVDPEKAAEAAKIQQAKPHLKAIITGLNNLGDNPGAEQIEAIRAAYNAIYDILSESILSEHINAQEEFVELVDGGFEQIIQELEAEILKFILIGAKDNETKWQWAFNNAFEEPGKLEHSLMDFYLFYNMASQKLLYKAVHEGNVEYVKKLIAQGVNANDKDKKGKTALDYALEKNDLEIKKALIDTKDAQGITPLHRAAAAGEGDTIEVLVAAGADVHAVDNQGLTPLHRAAAAGDVDAINALIARGADVNAKDNQNLTPLHHAAGAGNVEAIKALLAKDASINIQGDKNVTALQCAAFNHKVKAAAALILAGADDVTSNNYITALEINKGLMEAYKQELKRAGVEDKDIETDPIVVQMKKLQSEMKTAKTDKAVQPAVLAQTLNAVNKELKNHIYYRFEAKKGQEFKPAHDRGELNDLIQKSKDSNSPYKKVAAYALMGIGVILTAGFLVGLGFITFGVAPAILTPVIAAIAPIVSFKIAVAVGLTASASIGGSVGCKAFANKDAKVLDTAGEAVKIIRTESVKQKIEGATDFFKPKKGFFASMFSGPDVEPININTKK